jgi:hypothetical protein
VTAGASLSASRLDACPPQPRSPNFYPPSKIQAVYPLTSVAKKTLPLLLAALILPGCAWTVRAPSTVTDPVPVWITEYGKHCRVALPTGDSTFTEYGFGEWNFYGREQRGWLSTLRAGIGLGTGAFSRRTLTPDPDGTLGPRQTGGTRSEHVQVERAQADALRRELDARWQRNQAEVRIRQWDGVPVSRDPARYHLLDNSNHATARWLRQLGCEVRGYPLMANFRVED